MTSANKLVLFALFAFGFNSIVEGLFHITLLMGFLALVYVGIMVVKNG